MNDDLRSTPRPLGTLVADAAATQPGAPAIIAGDTTHSYEELETDAGRVARGLVEAGVRPGDRVALFMPNCLELVLAYFACFKAGAIAVPLNTRYRWPEARYAIEHSGATTLLVHTALVGEIEVAALAALGVVRRHLAGGGELPPSFRAFDDLLTAREEAELPAVVADQDALILYTSGSTAKPKGVTLTHANVCHSLWAYPEQWSLTGTDGVVIGLSLSHAAGLVCQLLVTIAIGGRGILLPAFDPQAMLGAIEAHRATWTLLLPPQVGDLAEQASATAGLHDLGSLRFVIVGGDKTPLPTFARFREALGFDATEGCGITECIPYASNRPFGPRRLGSIGMPAPGTELRIDGARRPGDQGEMLLRGPGLMRGYWRDPEATSTALVGGWFRTGDLGWIDEDGYVWWAGRTKFIIVRGGSNISPLEIEEVMNAHPGVMESAVIGAPDEKLGQRVVAYAVTRQGPGSPSGEGLRGFVAERLAGYKVPEAVVLLPSLPTAGMGKVDRAALLRRVESDLRAAAAT